MDEAIPAVEEVLKHQSLGTAINRPRVHDYAGPAKYLATMQAADYQLGVFGFKTYSIVPGNHAYFVYLFDAESGDLLAIFQADKLGRPITSARVYSPNPDNRNAYAQEMSQCLGIEVTPVESARRVVQGADILITVTSSQTPVVEGEWLEPGVHITAVGGANPYVSELDSDVLQRADLLVADEIAQLRIESGEFMMPAARGEILWEQVRELWQIVSGAVPGRRSPEDITLFKSLGMALWDVAAGKAVYDKAIIQGVGRELGS
jgi:ornithine cyclodeaminase/alanine dehydrogenase-like protein (mu-crystallin family)